MRGTRSGDNQSDCGQGLAEYTLIIAVAVVLLIAAFALVAPLINAMFAGFGSEL